MFPNSWYEITVGEYIELTEIDLNDELSFFGKNLEKICLLTDSDDWENEPITKVISIIKENDWLISKIPGNYKNEIGKFVLAPFTKMTLAEWIDLEGYIINKKIINIAALIYKQHKVDDWGNIIFEPYKYKTNERIQEFEDLYITDVYGAIEDVIKFREQVLSNYSELFVNLDEDFVPDEEDKELLSEKEIEEIKKDIKKQNERKEFAWQKLLDDICGGDWTRIEKLLEMPVLFVFNMLLMKEKFRD